MHHFRKYANYFVIPSLVIMAVFALYPVVHSFILSFFKTGLGSDTFTFAGLSNYINAFSDSRTLNALKNTAFFTLVSVILELILGFTIALFLHEKFMGRQTARAVNLIPWAIPTVVAALLWRWIFNDRFGILNELLVRVGIISNPKAFLSIPFFSKCAIIAVEVWKTTPFISIILLAGLEMIPKELYESAKVDGANAIMRFFHITLPLMKPIIIVSLLFRTMDSLRIFDSVYVLTGGGPGNSTETISLYAYKKMFSHLDFTMGSTLSVITFVLVIIVSAFYLLLLKNTMRESS